ncbi:histone-arginine methyltransferase METTL23-like isoform X2 [Argiope bruennichi]|uniref:histone-arginine methyltransferase METTL23-like isoform X2 n=1 Tax=Argiope bruennichi TaxID=94029 RepID=UPI0024940767|nr:histone-arginine methyltransferase METTL23-like isoform X2 [Argiope bruennichi]
MSVQKLNDGIFIQKPVKTFHFTDETDIIDISCSSSDSLLSETDQHLCNDNCALIKVKEVLDPSFGMYVWPCAPVLGKYIWHNRKRLKDKVIIELGCGTGLISVLAAKCGAYPILTDSKKYGPVFKIAEENMKLNNIDCKDFEIQELTWGYITPFIIRNRPIDFILGSDVFYCPKDFEDLIVTVSYILKKNAGAEFWCTYEHRCSDWNIDYLLRKWDLCCREISLEDFGADRFSVAGHDLPGLKTISLFVFSYAK